MRRQVELRRHPAGRDAFGRKRQIDQSVCNKDYSCLKGFCPSFVTVEGGELVKGLQTAKLPGETTIFPVLPEPELPALDRPWSILVTGIGGTGVVTAGHILGMAAHLEGKGSGIIDMAGLSQKNGAVVTHLKLARRPRTSPPSIAAGGADLILGCDLVTSAAERVLATASRSRTSAIVNAHQTMPAQFTGNPDFKIPADEMRLQIEARTRADGSTFIDLERHRHRAPRRLHRRQSVHPRLCLAEGAGAVEAEAIEQAIELNGVSVKMNLQAFLWGRRAAHDRAAVEAVIAAAGPQAETRPETLAEMVDRRVASSRPIRPVAMPGPTRPLSTRSSPPRRRSIRHRRS